MNDEPMFHFVYDEQWRIVAMYQEDGDDHDIIEQFVYHNAGQNRCQDHCSISFRGRPRGRSVMSRPRRWAIIAFQRSAPSGTPRVIDCRTAVSDSSSIEPFTCANQFRGRETWVTLG